MSKPCGKNVDPWDLSRSHRGNLSWSMALILAFTKKKCIHIFTSSTLNWVVFHAFSISCFEPVNKRIANLC